MNKRKLYESIMRNIKRNFKYGSLNEGFSAWRDEHMPKFDFDTFKSFYMQLISVLGPYINNRNDDAQIISINFLILDENTNKYKTLNSVKEFNDMNDAEVITNNLMEQIKQYAIKESQRIQIMERAILTIDLQPDSMLAKYINAQADPSRIGSLKDINSIIYKQKINGIIKLIIKATDLVKDDENENIIKFFS